MTKETKTAGEQERHHAKRVKERERGRGGREPDARRCDPLYQRKRGREGERRRVAGERDTRAAAAAGNEGNERMRKSVTEREGEREAAGDD